MPCVLLLVFLTQQRTAGPGRSSASTGCHSGKAGAVGTPSLLPPVGSWQARYGWDGAHVGTMCFLLLWARPGQATPQFRPAG